MSILKVGFIKEKIFQTLECLKKPFEFGGTAIIHLRQFKSLGIYVVVTNCFSLVYMYVIVTKLTKLHNFLCDKQVCFEIAFVVCPHDEIYP